MTLGLLFPRSAGAFYSSRHCTRMDLSGDEDGNVVLSAMTLWIRLHVGASTVCDICAIAIDCSRTLEIASTNSPRIIAISSGSRLRNRKAFTRRGMHSVRTAGPKKNRFLIKKARVLSYPKLFAICVSGTSDRSGHRGRKTGSILPRNTGSIIIIERRGIFQCGTVDDADAATCGLIHGNLPHRWEVNGHEVVDGDA